MVTFCCLNSVESSCFELDSVQLCLENKAVDGEKNEVIYSVRRVWYDFNGFT